MFWMIYITNPDRATAARIGKHLVEKRIAACCCTFRITDSICIWKGKMTTAGEWAVIVKTAKPDAVEKEVKKIHPYEVPCIIRWKVSANADYEKWLTSTVRR